MTESARDKALPSLPWGQIKKKLPKYMHDTETSRECLLWLWQVACESARQRPGWVWMEQPGPTTCQMCSAPVSLGWNRHSSSCLLRHGSAHRRGEAGGGDMRGSGETTIQMKYAPKGAVFVWCNGHLSYPKELAKKLGRQDLQIVSPSWLSDEGWQGLELSGVVLDHAARLTNDEWLGIEGARLRIRMSHD